MIHIFTDIQNQIRNKVSEVAWIDIDEGQFEAFGENAPVNYPCVLIDIPAADYEQQLSLAQTAMLTVRIRVAFRVFERLNDLVPTEFKDEAIAHFDILQKVMRAVHGLYSEHYGQLIRQSFTKGQSIDPKIYDVTYTCTMNDKSLQPDETEITLTNVFQTPKH